MSSVANVREWLDERVRHNEYNVTTVALDRLSGWAADPETGDIKHHTGGFYSVEGVRVEGAEREVERWEQPVIRQEERGILGLLVREFDGVPHFLLQAKMEPGNVNLVQLSPTVQATRSNYTGVHGGKAVPYLEHFLDAQPETVIADTLQSEQGSWFLAKQNRNIAVRVDRDVPVRDDFRWVSHPQFARLLRMDNTVNMDTRSVVSTAVSPRPALADTADGPSLHSFPELQRWFAAARARSAMRRESLPLARVRGWCDSGGALRHEQGRHFDVTGVRVTASNREVTGWDQPMIAPVSRGVVAFLVRRFRGVPHLLVQARPEAGSPKRVELAPTVQCAPRNYTHLPDEKRPMFLDRVLGATSERVLFDALQSEEGGRFYHAVNRYMVVDLRDAEEVEAPGNFVWMAPDQLRYFIQLGNHVNVEARSLFSGTVL